MTTTMSDRPQAPPASQPPSSAVPDAPDKLPPLPLTAAGLTALNGLLAITCFALFFWDSHAAAPMIQRGSSLLVAAGFGGVTAGGLILVRNKRKGRQMKGSVWANPAIVLGLLLMTAAVFLPLLSVLSVLVNEGAGG